MAKSLEEMLRLEAENAARVAGVCETFRREHTVEIDRDGNYRSVKAGAHQQEPEGMRFSMASYGGRVTLCGYEITKYGEEGPYRVTTGYEVNVVYQGPTYYRSYAEASEAFDAAVRTLRAAKKGV